MYTVSYMSQGRPHKSDEMALIALAVDFLATLTSAEHKTAKVVDGNPKGDVTELAKQLLHERDSNEIISQRSGD